MSIFDRSEKGKKYRMNLLLCQHLSLYSLFHAHDGRHFAQSGHHSAQSAHHSAQIGLHSLPTITPVNTLRCAFFPPFLSLYPNTQNWSDSALHKNQIQNASSQTQGSIQSKSKPTKIRLKTRQNTSTRRAHRSLFYAYLCFCYDGYLVISRIYYDN